MQRVGARPRENRCVDGGKHATLDGGLGAHRSVPVVVVHACAVPGRSACVRIRMRLNADAVASMRGVPVEYVEAEDRHGRLRQALSVHSVGRRCRQTRRKLAARDDAVVDDRADKVGSRIVAGRRRSKEAWSLVSGGRKSSGGYVALEQTPIANAPGHGTEDACATQPLGAV